MLHCCVHPPTFTNTRWGCTVQDWPCQLCTCTFMFILIIANLTDFVVEYVSNTLSSNHFWFVCFFIKSFVTTYRLAVSLFQCYWNFHLQFPFDGRYWFSGRFWPRSLRRFRLLQYSIYLFQQYWNSNLDIGVLTGVYNHHLHIHIETDPKYIISRSYTHLWYSIL